MRYLIITLVWSVVVSCNSGTSIKIPYNNKTIPLSSKLSQLFRSGEHTVTLTTNKELTPLQKNTLKKFLTVLSNNRGLQKEADSFLENPELTEHIPNFGLSRNELGVLSSIFVNRETSTEKGTVAISTDEESISLKGSGLLSILDSLTIILKDTSAFFKGTKLEYSPSDSSYILKEIIPSGEHLEYVFPFHEASNGILTLFKMGERFILFTGRLNKSGKTYLYLEVKTPPDVNKPFSPFYSIIFD